MNVYPLTIRIRPSRRLAVLVTAVHGATAASFLASSLPFLAQALAWMVLTASLAHSLVRLWTRRGQEFVLLEDGTLGFFMPDGQEAVCALDGRSADFGWVVWLLWKGGGEVRSGAMMLMPDQMASHDWRHLRTWLRLLAPLGARQDQVSSCE